MVFALPVLEASAFIGVVVPGEIAIVLGGVLANQGVVPLWAVLGCAIAGAVIGDSVGYLVGERFGHRLLGRLPQRIVRPDHVERTEQTIRRLGGRAVLVGRFTAALRALVPGMAGMAGMPYRTFLPWNVIGGALWASAYVLLGYAAGSQYARIEHDANLVAGGLLVAVCGRLRRPAALASSRGRRPVGETPCGTRGVGLLGGVYGAVSLSSRRPPPVPRRSRACGCRSVASTC